MGKLTGLVSPDLAPLLENVELHLACSTCCTKKYGITYTYHPSNHSCTAQLLLAKCVGVNNGNEWYEVRRRPAYPVPARYIVCWHYQPKKGCIRHYQNCSFAWCTEEIHVWSFEKTHKLERNHLRSLLLPSSTPSTNCKKLISWEDILSEFGGKFQDICEQCFYQSPPVVTDKDLCQSHPRAVPLLAHIVVDDTRKQCHAIQPLPSLHHIHLCSQLSQGFLCRAESGHCPNAHSEVELAVWKAEQKFGLSRSKIQESRGLNMGFYCRLCLVSASTQESFEVHCSSLEHGRMMAADSLSVWNHRAPPLGMNRFLLCENPYQCIYGNGCQKAHSQDELQEWILRVKVCRRNKHVMEEEGLQSYQDRLVQEYQRSGDTTVLSKEVDGVKITCSHPLTIHSKEKPLERIWNFTVHSKFPLLHVALLKTYPGAVFSLVAEGLPKFCPYAAGDNFLIKGSKKQNYHLGLRAHCSVFGVFEQWLTLDFGIRPVFLQKIVVQVGGQEEPSRPQDEGSDQDGGLLPSSERWYPDKHLCIPCKNRTQDEKCLLEKYKPPTISACEFPKTMEEKPFTVENYKQIMHFRIVQEEAAREEVISRLNLKVFVTFSKMVMSAVQGMKVAPNGELFAEVTLPTGITQDTEEGYLLLRSVNTALVSPCLLKSDKVYEVHVDRCFELENSILLQIPERCCQELSLKEGACVQLEIQFQLDRLQFCIYREAVDRLLDVKLLLPDLSKCCLPDSPEKVPWGNTKQQTAISYIAGLVSAKGPVAPLLIYGPFGTGKTSTVAKAALQVIRQAGTRVLICTHNNSAADLYIQEHFHSYVESGHPEATILRVKYTLSPVNRTDPITQQYCLLNSDKSSFVIPSQALLEQYRIVVTTAVMARELDVPRGFFSHILLDESAQMMESEALIPLSFANHWTRVVVAGDHMQETPRVFNRTACEEHTLLTRLFSYYQGKDVPAAKNGRIIFHQNYRSVPAIISFVSRCFYFGRDDAIEACAVETMDPPHGCHALGLIHVHGLCSAEGNSWVNQSEVLQVIEVVKEVLQRWPDNWGKLRRNKICVVSQGSQVKLIRQELRNIRLSDITVTSFENILGCEYLVIILSTVRSVDSLPVHPPASSTFSLDFFCDPRIVNTILTRARSQVIVVGDVVALCSFGGCSRIWRNYLRECVDAGSAIPPELSVEEIKQVVCNRQAWRQQPGEEDAEEDSDSWVSDLDINSEDAILQELLDSKKDACVSVSEEGMLTVSATSSFGKKKDIYTHFPRHILEQYLEMQPNVYKRCQLIKEDFDRGYALTLDDSPPCHISVNGRKNCGLAFSGDKVVIQLLPDTQPQAGTVVGVLETDKKNHCIVCTMDPHDRNIMIPIDRSVTKIFCLRFKERQDCIPIREFEGDRIKTLRFEKLTQEMRRGRLFLVQVVCWRQGFYYPLGIVTRILPPVLTLEEGLEILNHAYGIESGNTYPKKASKEANKLVINHSLEKDRKDCRNIITFTVDPVSAKDLDDAISVEDKGDNYEIGVHITDLAAVIPQGGDLDNEAKERGVTFYPPEHDAVHMLPQKLCSNLCSLKPSCDRLTISLFVIVHKDADQMMDGYFCRTIICSDRQLSYEEANSILKAESGKPQTFNTVEGCLCIAEHFSKIHRTFRLEAAANYKQPDEDSLLGSQDAQRMIEELMIMYNSWVAEYLTSKEKIMHLLPVRCQNPPSINKIEELSTKFRKLLPFSAYLSHHLLERPKLPSPSLGQKVTMLTSVWENLQDAAQNHNHSRITDLLSTDDLHPELFYAVREFRRQLGRSYFSRSGTQNAGCHYSLQVCAYTWASSPLRRYIDIVVQRLLHKTLTSVSENVPTISAKDIDLLCCNFDIRVKKESTYEKTGYALKLALSLHKEVKQKLAVVVTADSKSRGLNVAFPLNGDSLSSLMVLEYSALQPVGQPTPTESGTSLSWKRRVYSYTDYREQPLRNVTRKDLTAFSSQAWHEAVKSIIRGEPKQAILSLKEGVEIFNPMSFVGHSPCGHYMNLTLHLHPGDSLPVQLCTVVDRGLPTPKPQLCTPAPGIQLCLEHTSRPVDCFSSLANRPPLKHYRNVREYQLVWFPLCAMEAVESAVGEGAGILLRDVPVRWEKRKDAKQAVGMQGAFTLSSDLIQDCDLDMDFRNCYLCVRMDGIQSCNVTDLTDAPSYTWVAHGVTKYSNQVSKEEGGDVEFRLHQATMKQVPGVVLKPKATFTLEIIPKLLPDIRKEMALGELAGASELAKNIVLGKQIPDRDLNTKFKSQRSFTLPDFSPLNNSQTEAVRKALTQPFTLIQGPPGTGKTVVGAHLVYWFNQVNQHQETPTGNEEEEPGRRMLMYCGPSNKSVDVVAVMLLSLKRKLPLLRVYSEQIELSEFPYPGSNLKVSGYLREGKSHPGLRSITLHYLIREPSNPYSNKIREMDRRIQSGEEISLEDVELGCVPLQGAGLPRPRPAAGRRHFLLLWIFKAACTLLLQDPRCYKLYKKLRNDARKFELDRHDIILCTCICSSSAFLSKLQVSQIIIDECAMCTESETLVPIICHKSAQSIVLLGDHRQLRPVIKNDLCRILKMDRSLFERYEERALLLDTQYRMHSDICEFPSAEFYDGRLHTSPQLNLQPSLFNHQRRNCCPLLFGEVDGVEESLVVTSEEGNFNSKANKEEAKQAVRLAKLLVRNSISPNKIAILTPYNAQVAEVTKILHAERLSDVTVCTIMKSQGSEWQYVIFSTVRTASLQELDSHPTYSWLRLRLGFLGDPNQINVALTRAKEGLCVLGEEGGGCV
ncbi:3'-5' exoribonuclease HELZ2 isoform X2 [Pseudophryne corroboree]|uniref:3'-5' exoribonuclease HELZ2 isoform X2 n=1 Tax=Pseudophryne corroboree TaxID=495146 RepID=UPI0030812C41